MMEFAYHHDHEGESQNSACTYEFLTGRVCGASWDSALHPPDQYRHWCAALEAGGDCIHEELPPAILTNEGLQHWDGKGAYV